MLTLNDGRSELWQWDTGRKLTVDADCSQVHFSNKVFGRSIDVNVIDGVANIPDILLQIDKELTAWAFVGTAENGYTKISKIFKVNKRNKPADYVFTPVEQTTLAEVMERLENIESTQDPDAIRNAVEDYLANNPIQIDETDPTVPDWAKQPEKPEYTAAEVGALPADTPIPSPYTLPVATAETLGGVKPVAATAEMTQPVGVDAVGALFTVPSASGGASAETGWKLLLDYTREDEAVAGEGKIQCTEDVNGNAFEVREIMVVISGTVSANFPKAVLYIGLYSRNDCTKVDGGKLLTYGASRSTAGDAGTNYTSTISLSVFGDVWRALVIGGQADTTIAQGAQKTNDVPDLIRSISLSCFGNSAWGSIPLTEGGNVKIYGRL